MSTDANPVTPLFAAIVFPPYGLMDADWSFDPDNLRIPGFFRLVGGAVPTPVQYAAWLDGLVAEIAAFLWPEFDPAVGGWSGASAGGMTLLTQTDLDLIASLRPMMKKPIAGRGAPVTHEVLFLEEDEAPPGKGYERYDNLVSPVVRELVPPLVRAGMARCGSLPFQLKQRFQRPRPYQAAFMLKRKGFDYLRATSAVSPALVSGHAMQSAVFGCHAYLMLKDDIATVSNAPRFLKQWTVDPGDRRVFAGVHYPSDSLASWFCALRLCSHVYGARGQEAKTFLWEAISQNSAVFAAVRNAAATAGSPYVAIVKALEAEAARAA